ncbi:MAG: D-glycerate dehydrogenase [Phaeovulum sp.]|uniref:2-hydroxyacid dehydrogenase n=1 Tax=Phaeovulum sp. TaxID=2934796 RepID=UPI0027302A00|nr:D-glycerate dehydrogenase [Phaeovulum sp.]MDP2062958.1 D-glycerate dehydrogenase [Phaeovulum sp.]
MRVLVSRRLTARVEAALAAFDTRYRDSEAPMTLAECRAALAGHDAVVPTLGDGFSAEAFTGPVRARLLANFGVGYNHIDVAAASAAGVAVTNTPGAVTDATADIAMLLLLMSARRAGAGERLLRSGRWRGWQPTQLLGQHVSGKSLGLVGMGRIGRAVARRAHFGFGMQVRFFNRSALPDPGLPARQVATLHEAMAADFVVVAVPGGAATRHLIDAAALAAMPRHGHLVNIARGDVVDEAALIAALEAGQIAGAGLDVYAREPLVPARLLALENATLLPHLGTAAEEVRDAMGMMVVANLAALASGAPLPNPV